MTPEATGPEPLDTYRAKRDFERTPEPGGGSPSPGSLRYVVQEHHASRLHWDFRLELDGVLLSWAVPKGPSPDPANKRLAVRTEDHPLDYADFEGEIPAGEYGGGTVIIWDRGSWEPLGDARAGLEKGDLKFVLHGSRLQGRWVLVRMKPRPKERGENWLLIKERDEFVHAAGFEPPQIALCTLVASPPLGPGWLSEVKYDGYRLTISLEDGHARCFSRNGHDVTERFSSLARAAEALPATSALLDGEAVVFDEQGRTDFGALQRAISGEPQNLSFVAFDLLALNGHDVSGLATLARKELLATLLAEPEGAATRIVFAHHVLDDAAAFFETACAQGLEGAVFKRAEAPYPHGRTRTWLKAKCRLEQEFVVVGFTQPQGSRVGFGALALSVYDEEGRLASVGLVGSGFSESDIAQLTAALAGTERPDPPFIAPAADTGHSDMTWVEPRLVVRVAFAQWTEAGSLRHSSYRGLRDDVAPASVHRENPQPPDRVGGEVVLGVSISNPSKRLFPESALTKLDLARYYEAVASVMLPEVADRPLTLLRCPVGGKKASCFYQRHPDRGGSTTLRVLKHALASHDEIDEWLTVTTADGLVALAQMGVAEIHTWASRSDAPTRPNRLVFDLDPGPDVPWEQIAGVARLIRTECAALGFSPYLKSTGSKGLHVVMAIEPVWEFDRVRALARGLAERIAKQRPDEVTSTMAKSKRSGRVFIDYLRNAEGASAVAPYSPRHLPGAPIAVPLAWEELDDPSLDIRAFTPERVLQRVAAGVDPWADLSDSASGSRVLRAAEDALGT